MSQPDTSSFFEETGFDRPLLFSVPDRDARGRLVRLGPVLGEILSAHDYPTPIRRLLAEALALTALMGTLLKESGEEEGEGGQLTLQAQTNEGVIDLLVCDFRGGELRGYVRHDRARLDELGPTPPLFALFGEGYLAITFDLPATGQRYQGIVPLEGASLAEACENYFFQSEQVPTLIRTAIDLSGPVPVAGAFLVQHLPEGEEGRERLHVRLNHPEWEHVSILAGSLRDSELIDHGLSLEALVWRLFHEEREVRVEHGPSLTRGCRCTSAHYREVLSRFAPGELAEMADDNGVINVDCEFCSKSFPIEGLLTAESDGD